MLVINPGWWVTSERPDEALFPYVLKDFRGQSQSAGEFLSRSINPDWMISVLMREIAGLSEAPRLIDSRQSSIVEAVSDLVAQGMIEVAESLRSEARLVFLATDPRARDLRKGVRFAREMIAVDFLGRCLIDPASQTAVDSALAFQPIADRQLPDNPDDVASWLAHQLMLRRLGLFPIHGDARVLRLAWIEHNLPSRVEAVAASPPSPRPAAAQIVQMVVNTMPDLPAEISAQAQTLMTAAAAGVPFCEECAKAAAARANA